MTQEPKVWCDMTRAEKGELLLAKYENKVIECYEMGSWNEVIGIGNVFYRGTAYRIKPEPKRERVRLAGGMDTSGNWSFCMDEVWPSDTHKITFDLIDGKPDPASIKIWGV